MKERVSSTGSTVVLVLFTLLFTSCASSLQDTSSKSPAQKEIADAVEGFLQTLEKDQHEQATFSFQDDQRKKWHFIPDGSGGFERKGLPLKTMNEQQRQAAFALLETLLSSAGYEKARQIIQLEAVLKRLEKRDPQDSYRDTEKYFFSVFGNPSEAQPWGLRVEGHHLSLNYSSVTDKLVATPSFWGANPETVPNGPKQGLQVLEQEISLARELMVMFDASQKNQAIIADKAYRDIITTPGRADTLNSYEGLPVSKMNNKQRKKLRTLIKVYLNSQRQDIAGPQFGHLLEGNLENIYFAWAGSTNPNEGHYYRIYGPEILIEYDNTQTEANHAHTILRDPGSDFGEDLLRQHYRNSNHHK